MMNLAQLERLRYVTSHYRELQGLILAPFGLIFLVPALIPGGWGQQGETWRWLAIAAAVALSWLASRHDRRSVGRVHLAFNPVGRLLSLAGDTPYGSADFGFVGCAVA